MISTLRCAALASRLAAVGKPITPYAYLSSLRDVRSHAMATMKAVVFDQPGSLEVLQYKDVEKPQPGQVCQRALQQSFMAGSYDKLLKWDCNTLQHAQHATVCTPLAARLPPYQDMLPKSKARLS